MRERLTIVAGLAVLLVLAGWAGSMDYQDELLEERAYCSNVTLYHATAGEHGWPDYNDNYVDMCAKYSSEPEFFFRG